MTGRTGPPQLGQEWDERTSVGRSGMREMVAIGPRKAAATAKGHVDTAGIGHTPESKADALVPDRHCIAMARRHTRDEK